MTLSDDEKRRYARHLLLPAIGPEGQARLLGSSILVVGAGGLGAASIAYLAAAGIGRLGLLDHDHVELSNLNRQIIHETGDIGRRKVESAADRIAELNPQTLTDLLVRRFEDGDPALVGEYDLVLDGSDNFPTRFAVAAACHQHARPLVSAAIRGFDGQISTFTSFKGAAHPCYRCLVPDLPGDEQDCAVRGVVGPLVGILGAMQALEAIKELLEIGRSLSGRLLCYAGLTAEWREYALPRNPGCPLCGG